MLYDRLSPESPIDTNIDRLAQAFPSVVREGKVDFDALRQLLGDDIGEPHELYGLNWKGKAQARRAALTPSLGTLRPCPEESVDWDSTKNLYIEGDNLEVLKLLRKSYSGKVKMIYIDPPYNTGNEFVYEDDYQSGIGHYKKLTEQEETLPRNVESNGKFHTDWLNMMYPRLMLARDLLCEDGIIFISIDEHEIHNLAEICTDVFGQSNYLNEIVWDKRNPKGEACGLSQQHEYIVACTKNKGKLAERDYFYRKKEHAAQMLAKAEACLRSAKGNTHQAEKLYQAWLKTKENEFSGGEMAYKFIDENGNVYQPVSMAAPDKPETRSHTPLLHPITQKPCPVPAKGWRFPSSTMNELLLRGEILFGKDETTQPRRKYLLKENMLEAVPSMFYYGGSEDAVGLPFDNPKPTYLIQRLLECTSKDNLILDFFSGSATAAHSVMKLNAEDGGNRRYIMVQLPEPCDKKSEAYKAGYKNICEIGKERIRRAGRKLKEEAGLIGQGLDTGFRVYKLDSSNVKPWDPDAEDLGASLDLFSEHLVEGRTSDDLLTEVMLKSGIDLCEETETREIAGHRVYSLGYGQFYACMDLDLSGAEGELALGIAAWHAEECAAVGGEQQDTCTVFVADEAFAGRDDAKMNFVSTLQQYGICNVKAL